MTDGHGDDIYQYPHIQLNFSSNVYSHFEHRGLFDYLTGRLEAVKNYPEPTPQRAEKAVATALGLQPRQVMVTNGATEGIYLVSQAFRCRSSAILIPTFAEYADACRLHGHTTVFVKKLADITQTTAQMVWLCNPNNPTGAIHDKDSLLACISQHPQTLFVIDASYASFTQEPLITPTEAIGFPNLVMLHSMTKAFSIPGLRLGYITACEGLLDNIRRHRMPWSVNTLAQEACCYLLAHEDDYRLPIATLLTERERIGKALAATGAVQVYPSHTHILLCRLRTGKASDLKERLINRYGILIRDASNFEGLDDSHFRIAVQTPEENDQLLASIIDTLSQHP